jgi:hypothetical protein
VHARSLHSDKTAAFQWTPLIANFKFSTNESSKGTKSLKLHGEQNFVKPQITGDYKASLGPENRLMAHANMMDKGAIYIVSGRGRTRSHIH